MTLVNFVASTDRPGQLMLAYAAGDTAAFEELYRHYRGQLYRFFLRHCGNSALAEELYQELWLRVIRRRNAYRHTARFSTWLYRIALNLLRDQARRPRPRVVEAEPDELLAEAKYEPAMHYAEGQRRRRLLVLLHALPEEQRQVFLLKEEAGLSLEEISQVTGTGFETVKSRLRYAVKKLREAAEDAA